MFYIIWVSFKNGFENVGPRSIPRASPCMGSFRDEPHPKPVCRMLSGVPRTSVHIYRPYVYCEDNIRDISPMLPYCHGHLSHKFVFESSMGTYVFSLQMKVQAKELRVSFNETCKTSVTHHFILLKDS